METPSNIERNIVKEIMRECYRRKMKMNEHFVLYYVKLLLLDPNWGITDNFMNSRVNVQNFVKYVIDQLRCSNSPKIVTLKMQFYFSCNMQNMDGVVRRSRKDLLHRLARLKEDILKVTVVESDEEVSKLYKKIVMYITLISGLGDPTIEKVFLEGLAGFRSVMNEEELKEYVKLDKSTKEKQLHCLAKVVSGIRLFNKDCEKGGMGIADLPWLLDKALAVMKDELQNSLLIVMDKVNLLTTVMDKCYVLKDEFDEYTLNCNLTEDVEIRYMTHAVDLLILYRQYELYVRKILEDLNTLEEHLEEQYENFERMLKDIHQVVFIRVTIPASTVFPLFESLCNMWTQLQDQVYILVKYSQIMITLDVYSKEANFNKDLLESMIDDEPPLTDAQRLAATTNLNIKSQNEDVQISTFENFHNIDKVKIQYLGFCCWKLVETQGGLIPGNVSMGVAKYHNMNFVFSIPEACSAFSTRPEDYIKHILDLGRRKPQLINFLQIKEQLQLFMNVAQLVEERVAEKSVDHKGIQCEHYNDIIPTRIVPDYKWNVWDLKREALSLADLYKKKTVSTQTTTGSNAVAVNTYRRKDSTVQTKKDNYSNVPRPLNFIFGLRGTKDDKQFVVDLTRPVEE